MNKNILLLISIPILVVALYFMVIHRSDSKTMKEEVPIHFYMNCDLTNQTKDSLIQLIDLYAADKNKMYVQTFLVKGNDDDENLKAVVATVNRVRMFFNDDYYTHANRKRDINNFYDLYTENKSNYTSFFKKQNSRRKNYEGDVIYDKDFSSIAQLKAIVTDKIASGSSTISVVFNECITTSPTRPSDDEPGDQGPQVDQGPTAPQGEPRGQEPQVDQEPTAPQGEPRVQGPTSPRQPGSSPPPPKLQFLSHDVSGNYNIFSWSSVDDCNDCEYSIQIKCAEDCEGGDLDYKYQGNVGSKESLRLNLGSEERGVSYKKHDVTVTSKRNGKKTTITKRFELVCKQL
jgi:hypothetical protein